MDQLIPLVNRLQDIFATAEGAHADEHKTFAEFSAFLPQIVVVGSQSSGKSSVLENIVGKDFLPRGTGIVTRRPLVLQLVHLGSQNDLLRSLSKNDVNLSPEEFKTLEGREFGVFLHKRKIFSDFADIRKEIQEETKRILGTEKGVSAQAIHLKIFSPQVPNLTLVDLPGMIRVAAPDQPHGIDELIKDIIMEYISNPNSIILAVSAANTDLATSDALHIAMQVDPKGERTLGVLTKLDLMDRGTNAADILNGQQIPLKLGYVGVVNRSQEDITSGKPIEEALTYEADFFKNQFVYRDFANRTGTPCLTQILKTVLIAHIRKTLPELKSRIEKRILECEKDLRMLGMSELQPDQNKGAFLLHLISKFCIAYSDAIEGRSQFLSKTKLSGGAKINYIFHNFLAENLKTIDPSAQLTDQEILMTIRCSKGPRPCLFVPEIAFEILVKNQIARLEHPSLECVEYVFRELKDITDFCANNTLGNYRRLKDQVLDTFSLVLQECLQPAKAMVKNMIACEISYVNTNHPDFITGSKAVTEAANERKKKLDQEKLSPDAKSSSVKPVDQFYADKVSDREQTETDIIRTLIKSYFKIIKKQIQDAVPKAIMHFLVNKSKESIQSELVRSLYKEELFEALLQESDDAAVKRKDCMKLLTTLKQALLALEEFHFTQF